MMQDRPKVIAFDVDTDSLASLRQAFPEWEVEATNGATSDSLEHDWSPAPANLLVVAARARVAETLGLCRGLRSQAGRAQTPLLVPPDQEALVRAALDTGADGCLVLPVNAKDLVSMVARVRGGNRPGRHTLSLDRTQQGDAGRDEGGEA